jgi:NAD(P)-dependent dehydrogenase (short-subunit alcohol dehydrogenase family)
MLEQKAIQAKINLITVPIDLTDEQTISQAVEFVKKDLPADIKLWSLINTPSEHNEYDDNHLDTFKSVMELNYLSEIRCTHAFIPLIKKSKGGRIAITKSISEELILRWGNTQVPKTALNTFLEQLAYVYPFICFEQYN